MREARVSGLSPKEYSVTILGKFIEDALQKGEELILSIDANESVDGRTNVLSERTARTGLVDFHAITTTAMSPRTYLGGQRE